MGVIAVNVIPSVEEKLESSSFGSLLSWVCRWYQPLIRNSRMFDECNPPSKMELVYQTSCIVDRVLGEEVHGMSPTDHLQKILDRGDSTSVCFDSSFTQKYFKRFRCIVYRLAYWCLLFSNSDCSGYYSELAEQLEADIMFIKFLDNVVREHQDWLRQLRQLMPSYGQDGRYLSTLIESQMPDNPYCHGLKPAVKEPEEVTLEEKKIADEQMVHKRNKVKYAIKVMKEEGYFTGSREKHQYAYIYKLCFDGCQIGGESLPYYQSPGKFIKDLKVDCTVRTINDRLSMLKASKYPKIEFTENSRKGETDVTEAVNIMKRFLVIYRDAGKKLN